MKSNIRYTLEVLFKIAKLFTDEIFDSIGKQKGSIKLKPLIVGEKIILILLVRANDGSFRFFYPHRLEVLMMNAYYVRVKLLVEVKTEKVLGIGKHSHKKVKRLKKQVEVIVETLNEWERIKDYIRALNGVDIIHNIPSKASRASRAFLKVL